MTVPTLLLRTDASSAIGLGHAMRLLALGQALADRGGRVHLAFSEMPGSILRRFAAEGVELHRIEHAPGTPGDALATASLAKAVGAPWTALDGYRFTAAYRQATKAAGLSLLVMDDLAEEPMHEADVVVNPNVYAAARGYVCSPSTRLLLGPKYALLRREFLSLRRRPSSLSTNLRYVLVTLGGSDPDNITSAALRALDAVTFPFARVDVIIGGANPHREQLQRLAEASNKPVRLLHDVHDMAQILARADLAVAGGGTTALELAFAGVPSILCQAADNQRDALQAFHTQRAALTVGLTDALTVDAVHSALMRLIQDPDMRQALALRAQKLVDGQGPRRILQVLFPDERDAAPEV